MQLQTKILKDAFGTPLSRVGLPSGSITPSGALVHNGPGVFLGFVVTTDGVNDAVVNVYDNTSASGTKLIPTFTVEGADRFGGVIGHPILVTTGIYVSVTGTGAEVVAYYLK